MNDTPKTDAMVWQRNPVEFDGEIVAADFARYLERENIKLLAENTRLIEDNASLKRAVKALEG